MSGFPSWARVGAKVVCVLSDWTDGERSANADVSFPAEGGIYTIREVTTTYWDGFVAVRLVEIINPVILWSNGPAEPAFAVERFRPLITQADDIATHFRQHLDVREPVGV